MTLWTQIRIRVRIFFQEDVPYAIRYGLRGVGDVLVRFWRFTTSVAKNAATGLISSIFGSK